MKKVLLVLLMILAVIIYGELSNHDQGIMLYPDLSNESYVHNRMSSDEEEGNEPDESGQYVSVEEARISDTGEVDCSDEATLLCDITVSNTSNYTTLKTRVVFNPQSETDGVFRVELTWNVMPRFRYNDVISLSFDSTKIMILDTTLKGIVEYEYADKGVNANSECLEDCSFGIRKEYDLFDHPDLFGIANGIVFNAPLPKDTSGLGKRTEKVDALRITLEASFVVNGNTTFSELGFLRIAGDYRHQLPRFTGKIRSTMNVSLDSYTGGIIFTPSLFRTLDGSRYSPIRINLFK